MSITVNLAEQVVRTARTTFPSAVRTIRYGKNKGDTVQAFQSDSEMTDPEMLIEGEALGLRGRLKVILSECEPSDDAYQLNSSGARVDPLAGGGTFSVTNDQTD